MKNTQVQHVERKKRVRVNNNLTEKQLLEKIKELLDDGKSRGYIHRSLHIGHQRLDDIIEKNNLVVKYVKHLHTGNVRKNKSNEFIEKENLLLIEQIRDMREREISKKEICSTLHIGIKRLNELMEKGNIANIDLKKKDDITSKLIAEIQIKRDKKLPDTEICTLLNISMNKLNNVKKLLRLKTLKTDKDYTGTIEEKVVYANNVYGVNAWRFMTMDEVKSSLKADLNLKF